MNNTVQDQEMLAPSARENDDIIPFLVRRQSMEELSEYFEKDSRRYDRGFEFY